MKRKTSLKDQRVFSEELKREIVKLIETGALTVPQAQREYDIKSSQTVYTWIYRFSNTLKKGTRMVMEKESIEHSNIELRRQIKELEAALGRKALEADLYRTIVEQASREYKTDLKKNFGGQVSPNSKE
jgi:transposase